jgi:hypothetical protein
MIFGICPLTLPLSPAFTEAASCREALEEREELREDLYKC